MMDDCRCSICNCCKHDHNGWAHEWTPKTSPEPEADPLRFPGDYAGFPQRYVMGMPTSDSFWGTEEGQ